VWVVDAREKRVHVYRSPSNGTYESTETVALGRLAIAPFAGVEIDLAPQS